MLSKVSRMSSNIAQVEPLLTLHTQLGVSCPLKKKVPTKNFDQKTHATHEREGEKVITKLLFERRHLL